MRKRWKFIEIMHNHLGGGSVFANSWIWLCIDGVGRTRPSEMERGTSYDSENKNHQVGLGLKDLVEPLYQVASDL